jgi:RNA polymerase sigma-70 factor (ECF subfamily)
LLRHGIRFILLLEVSMLDASERGSWQQLSDRLVAYIRRRLPAEEAEDVRQDVLLRIFKGAPQLNDDTRFGPWVYSIARNAVIDRMRSRRPAPADIDGIAEPASPTAADAQPLLDCVAPFVARLPSPYREAITLTELRGLTQQEAAEIAGVSLSGMKSRVQRGRRLLRAMFEECCHLTIDRRGRVIDATPNSRRAGASDPATPAAKRAGSSDPAKIGACKCR